MAGQSTAAAIAAGRCPAGRKDVFRLQFGNAHYDNIAYFNFESEPALRELFEDSISPGRLVPELSRAAGQTITEGRKLVVFDEVQLCERALTSLKYFSEQGPGYHVVAAGSLLGIAVNRQQFPFPVGKVNRMVMYPLDFEEFLFASSEGGLAGRIRRSFESNEPFTPAFHAAALEMYRRYLMVGGMPKCVADFVNTGNETLLRSSQRDILTAYLDDMSKYNRANEIKKTRLVYESITAQLSKANTRFQYKLVKKGGRAAEFENAIEWLVLSGIASRVYKVEQPWVPLGNHRDINAFKMYFSDVGLLSASMGLPPMGSTQSLPIGSADFRGGLAENYVETQLRSNGYTPYFWVSARSAEVDFIIQREGAAVPIEVKSADNVKAKSLKVYMEAYRPTYAIKMSARNFGFEGGIKTVPLYAAFCL